MIFFVTEDKNRKPGGQLANWQFYLCMLKKKMKNDSKFFQPTNWFLAHQTKQQ